MMGGNYLILSSCCSFLHPYLLCYFAYWQTPVFAPVFVAKCHWHSAMSHSRDGSTAGLGHMLCKSTGGKTTWALPGLSFHTFLIFESASNTCASMNSMDTVLTHTCSLLILDKWLNEYGNWHVEKKEKGVTFVDIPTGTLTATPTATLTDSPAMWYAPASPQPHTAEQTVCFNMGGGKTQTETATSTASQITLQAVILPWNGDALTQPREIFILVFLTIPLFRL